MTKSRLEDHPIHLGLGAKASVEPQFTGEFSWYEAYGQRHDTDGVEGRLVAVHTFSAPWESWEVHPSGDEVVFCLAGEMVLIQEFPDGRTEDITLRAGEYAINPPGVWHTADVSGEATALFITAGLGTEHRPR